MRSLNLNNKQVSNNSYINYKAIYSIEDTTEFVELKLLDTNIPLSFDDFFNMLMDFENKYNNSKNKENVNIRYGVVLTYLLDSDKKEADTLSIIHSIAKYYGNLPYYCWYERKGKGNYLKFYFAEREFYKDGKKEEYAKDIYQNSKTGRLCNKNDIDAVLVHKKGEIKDDCVVYFSKRKADTFKFKDKKHFVEALFKFRSWYLDLLCKFYDVALEQGITFKKYVISCLEKNQRVSASKWNSIIRKLEDSFDNAFYILKRMGSLSDDAEEKLYNLYKQYQYIIKTRHFSLSLVKHKVKVEINYANYNDDYDLLLRKFEFDKTKLIQSCL